MELKYVRMYFPPPQGWLRWDFLTPKWLLAGIPSGGVEPVGARGAKKIFDGVWCQNSYFLRRRRLRPRRLLQRPQRLQPGPQHRH